MAKTAKDYKVVFGYGAKDGYYYGPEGIIGPYHRGNDRETPVGTPIVIGKKTIGLTGSTGLGAGPHLHTQAGTDIACQKTFDPTPLDFKPGTVVATGKGTQWGYYITIKVGSKYITYAHLSKISVRKGDKIKVEAKKDMVTLTGLNVIYRFLLGKQTSDYGKKHYLGKVTFDQAYKKILKTVTYKNRVKKIKAGQASKNDHLPEDIRKIK